MRPAAPVLSGGQFVDRQLDDLGLGEMWIRLYAVDGGEPIAAGLTLEPRGLRAGIQRIDATWVRIREPAGSYRLRIRSLTNDWQDSIRVRRGFADTLIIGFGHLWLCRL